jgi:HEAT repeat protein
LQLPTDELDRLRRAGFARNLTEEIICLTAVDNELVRLHALRALGSINADPSRAAPVLASKLASGNKVAVRRIAADGLFRLVATPGYLKDQSFKSPPVWANDLDVITAGVEVVRHAAVGLTDPDAEVRRCCAEALRTGAELLAEHFQRGPDEARSVAPRSHSLADIAALKALLNAFDVAGPRLAAALSDPAVEVRLAMVRTLGQLCDVRCRLAEEPVVVGTGTERVSLTPPYASDPLANFARGDWRSAARLLADPDARVRRGAVSFLEFFGEARPAVLPALAKSLADSDRFVRLGSARALGNFTKTYQPRDAAPIVPALAALLFDSDDAIRVAAAATLESIGPCAETAVPDLVRAIHFGDVENRVAALRVVETIGPDRSKLAIPSVTAALSHPDPRVRRAAAEALGKYGPVARNQVTTDALRRALSDPDQAVRIRASEAVRLILSPAMPSAR